MLTATVYETRRLFRRQWAWRIQSGNGEIIASGESYANKADAVSAVNILLGVGVNAQCKVTDRDGNVIDGWAIR